MMKPQFLVKFIKFVAMSFMVLSLAACGDEQARQIADFELQKTLSIERAEELKKAAAETELQAALVAQQNVVMQQDTVRLEGETRIEAIKEAGDQVAPVISFVVLGYILVKFFQIVVGYRTAQNALIVQTADTMMRTATSLFEADKITSDEYALLVESSLHHQIRRQPLISIGQRGA